MSLLRTQPTECCYFGCWGRAGHRAMQSEVLAHPELRMSEASFKDLRRFVESLDGCLFIYDESTDRWLTHWLGASADRQEELDARVPHLIRCPAAVRFLSLEPLLGAIDIFASLRRLREMHPLIDPGGDRKYLHWVIVGGESGAGARPCDVEWIRSIVKQCKAASVPVFVKQLGAWPVETNDGPEMPMRWIPDDGGEAVARWYKPSDRKGGDPSEWPEDLRVREMPEVAHG